jgi:hypothetical protein
MKVGMYPRLKAKTPFAFQDHDEDIDGGDTLCRRVGWWHLPSVRYMPDVFASHGKGVYMNVYALRQMKQQRDDAAAALRVASETVAKFSSVAERTQAGYMEYVYGLNDTTRTVTRPNARKVKRRQKGKAGSTNVQTASDKHNIHGESLVEWLAEFMASLRKGT